MTEENRVRVYVAGAWGAMIAQAIVLASSRNDRVDLIGISLERVDPAALRRARPDILVSAAHRWMLSPEILGIPRLGSVGVHPSLLPTYRGSWPLWWALVNGEPEVGVTAFRMTDDVDAGPILRQKRLDTRRGESYSRLYERIAPLAGEILNELIDEVLTSGDLPVGTPQDDLRATFVSTPSTGQRILGEAKRAVHRNLRRSSGPR
jgi:methionyl-tRNA formyltransferase